jgi:peptidoglycan/LPS O-acetylase OafA/YrhL
MLAWGAGVLAFYAATALPCAGAGDACLVRYGLLYAFTSWQAMYVTYLFIGTIFFVHFSGAVDAPRAAAAIAVQMVLFAASWPLSGFYAVRMTNPVAAYLLALAIFAACYAFRTRIVLSPLTRFFAEISYPLYAVHMLVGLAALRILTDLGLPYLLALPLVTAAIILIARVLHVHIEAPGMALGKRLAARLTPRK